MQLLPTKTSRKLQNQRVTDNSSSGRGDGDRRRNKRTLTPGKPMTSKLGRTAGSLAANVLCLHSSQGAAKISASLAPGQPSAGGLAGFWELCTTEAAGKKRKLSSPRGSHARHRRKKKRNKDTESQRSAETLQPWGDGVSSLDPTECGRRCAAFALFKSHSSE